MARLARYAHVSPDQFGRMTPARTLELDNAVRGLLDDEWRGYWQVALEHARLLATVLRGR